MCGRKIAKELSVLKGMSVKQGSCRRSTSAEEVRGTLGEEGRRG